MIGFNDIFDGVGGPSIMSLQHFFAHFSYLIPAQVSYKESVNCYFVGRTEPRRSSAATTASGVRQIEAAEGGPIWRLEVE